MSFYNKQLQVILQIYLSGNLSPLSEVYLQLKFTVTGQFVLTVCAFHGYALVGVLLHIFVPISLIFARVLLVWISGSPFSVNFRKTKLKFGEGLGTSLIDRMLEFLIKVRIALVCRQFQLEQDEITGRRLRVACLVNFLEFS